MKIKKLISILLGACFPLACFAGCGGNGASGGDGGEDGMNGGGTNEGEYLSYNEDVLNVEWLGMLTGPESANRTDMEYVVGGTDLGIPVYNSKNDTMYLFFGDTFQNEKNQTGYWRSNVVGLSKDYDLSDGLTFDSFLAGSSGIAKAVIDGHHADGFEMTKIPTGAVEVDGVLYMFYFSIRTWNPNSMNYGGAVKSTDNGETWERVYDMTWVDHDEGGYSADIARLVNEDIDLQENGGNIDIAGRAGNTFTQIFPIDGKDGYIYILGEGKYRQGGIRMGRVKKENIEVFEEYEYFNGIENGQRRRIECELKKFALTSAHNGFIGNCVFTREDQAGTGLGLFACAQHADDSVFAGHAFDHGFNGAASFLDAAQTSLDYARVVHHEQITGAKQMLEIRENKIFDHIVAHVQQAGSRAFCKRKLSDQFKREIKVVVGQMLSVEIGRM